MLGFSEIIQKVRNIYRNREQELEDRRGVGISSASTSGYINQKISKGTFASATSIKPSEETGIFGDYIVNAPSGTIGFTEEIKHSIINIYHPKQVYITSGGGEEENPSFLRELELEARRKEKDLDEEEKSQEKEKEKEKERDMPKLPPWVLGLGAIATTAAASYAVGEAISTSVINDLETKGESDLLTSWAEFVAGPEAANEMNRWFSEDLLGAENPELLEAARRGARPYGSSDYDSENLSPVEYAEKIEADRAAGAARRRRMEKMEEEIRAAQEMDELEELLDMLEPTPQTPERPSGGVVSPMPSRATAVTSPLIKKSKPRNMTTDTMFYRDPAGEFQDEMSFRIISTDYDTGEAKEILSIEGHTMHDILRGVSELERSGDITNQELLDIVTDLENETFIDHRLLLDAVKNNNYSRVPKYPFNDSGSLRYDSGVFPPPNESARSPEYKEVVEPLGIYVPDIEPTSETIEPQIIVVPQQIQQPNTPQVSTPNDKPMSTRPDDAQQIRENAGVGAQQSSSNPPL